MGFFDFLLRLLGLKSKPQATMAPAAGTQFKKTTSPKRTDRKLDPLRFQRERWSKVAKSPQQQTTTSRPFSVPAVKVEQPYPFAHFSPMGDGYLDLSQDGDSVQLQELELPEFSNPQQMADWLQMPVGQLAWLTCQFEEGYAHATEKAAHYHFRWLPKRNFGCRLIESPKPLLKQAQRKVLREILDNVPTHQAAHGFVQGSSILTNAQPHCGKRVVLKFDLENFYPHVRFSKVVAIFRSMGYSREASIWLSRLCMSRLPLDCKPPTANPEALWIYQPTHLPQGAPTSPTLANLAAYVLDVRLDGLARSFGADYSRYADDLTFSGDAQFLRSLKSFIPFVEKIIRETGFKVNKNKRKVIRNNQRQSVTGVTVNEHPNINRKEFDRLKAILHNCVRYGSESQNRDQLPDFQAHLRGRVAYFQQLNPTRAAKLKQVFEQIRW
ncbi:Reverse transcriptase (RNA-dependent DNA polymerase) [Polystyrenella longa]|uniref:RNA-directed DNA polymerase n=1 Tax=Polystyrenella longa TaxID=2528007 RepID=A0A518CK43_9PLAN|nr:reverse transcriptase family protein [Polystyrenella longa]QDU79593.1 Reverse transcriptase (RNA-dependent DNA polymerase) [Polystyrenella longa]